MEALQGRDAQEDSPTVVHLTAYILALDEQYDRQALELRICLRRAEEAEDLHLNPSGAARRGACQCCSC